MIKRKSIILSVLIVASLSCSPLTHKVGAEEQTRNFWHTGITTSECILLQAENPPISIKVIRSKVDLCADKVTEHNKDEFCEGKGIPIEIEKDPLKTEAYSVGNQRCPETIVVYRKSAPCFQYHSGCRKRYIPRG